MFLAAMWYQKAADKGDATGMFYLGVCYEKGKGVPQDKALSVIWYQKASDMGYKRATKQLANKYMNGEGVQRDKRHAARLQLQGDL